ncbi:MAG: hypothetical protein DMF02_06010 [Verrucomicrobia bacterium]|nr:MAG: hypothetical protein DMF02_06010 [Verrucomicrobiota bacterium]
MFRRVEHLNELQRSVRRERKAMRGRIALRKHFVRNLSGLLLCFATALGVRARPGAAFILSRFN